MLSVDDGVLSVIYNMNKSEKILQEVKDGYNQIAVHFDKTRYSPWQEFELFKQYIKDGQKILDLGCGNGRLYKFLKAQNLNVNYHGLDNAERLILISQEKYPEVAEQFKVGEMYNLPYNDSQFDIVICIATFHHLPTKDLRLKTLSEIHRVLKSGGYFLMTNWHLWHWPFFKYFFNQFSQKISWKDFIFPWKSPDGQIQCQRFYHAFTKGELRRLFRKSGFKVDKIFTHLEAHQKAYGRGVNVVSVVRRPKT